MARESWHTKAGGRKFIIVILGMALEFYAIRVGASVDAHLTIGGLVAVFVTGNWAVERVHAGNPNTPPRRDSSADLETS